MKNVFEMQDFTVTLEGGYGERLRVVSDVSLSIAEGKITGLIGESGSGKTVLWQTALGLRDPKHWSCAGGVWLAGRALDPGKPEAILRQRGESVSVILQDPMHLLCVLPTAIDFLSSDFKQQGLDSRQHLDF